MFFKERRCASSSSSPLTASYTSDSVEAFKVLTIVGLLVAIVEVNLSNAFLKTSFALGDAVEPILDKD